MDHIQAPALLAYRGGDVFATIVEIFRQIPQGRACSADSLEELLKQYVHPPTPTHSLNECILTRLKIPDLIMNSLIYYAPLLSFPFLSVFLPSPKCNDRIDLIGETREPHIHQTEWSLARRIEGFFFSCLSYYMYHANYFLFWSYTFVLFITLPLHPCMILLIDWAFAFLLFYWFGSVRCGLCWLCFFRLCLFYCSYATGTPYIRAYIHPSIYTYPLIFIIYQWYYNLVLVS